MRKLFIIAASSASLLLSGVPSPAQDKTYESKAAPDGARVYIIWPADGQVIHGGKFWLRMGLSGMGVAPAGVDRANTGHHHVLVDVPLPPLDQPIPNDKKHLHFGAGQTEARIELPPGRHTLQLVLGDESHVPFKPELVSKPITIVVPEE